jgi:hypothetical protein
LAGVLEGVGESDGESEGGGESEDDGEGESDSDGESDGDEEVEGESEGEGDGAHPETLSRKVLPALVVHTWFGLARWARPCSTTRSEPLGGAKLM